MVGIHIHGLKDLNENIAIKGNNPFDHIGYGSTGKKLSAIVKCYDPSGSTSKDRYAWISKYLKDAVEEAIDIRGKN